MSSTGICRDNDSAGGDLIPSQSTVYANGKKVIVNGDDVESHAPCPVVPIHCLSLIHISEPTRPY